MALSYNERGQFKGVATVIFKSNKNAALAVEKYHGASIDGGKGKLSLELIIDTTKKPLAARIAAKPVQKHKQPRLSRTKEVVGEEGKETSQEAPTKEENR